MTDSVPTTRTDTIYSTPQLLAYGLLGLPLAMVALPIYIVVPKFYADHTMLSLSMIGAILLLSRLLDALIDPLFGYLLDQAAGRGRSYRMAICLALPILAMAYVGLFHPPQSINTAVWLALSLLLVYWSYSLASIAHQSWGASLSQNSLVLARINGTREGLALLGVLLAAALPTLVSENSLTLLLMLMLILAVIVLHWAPPQRLRSIILKNQTLTVSGVEDQQHAALSLSNSLRLPWRNRRFRSLLLVFLLNGIASAIPATLILFFVRDVLQLEAYAGGFLVLYFLAGAASVPVWVRLAGRWGLARAWLLAMSLSVMAFIAVLGLGAGSLYGFAAVCGVSGLALGADLALPAALLTRAMGAAGHANQHEGAYFGWWNLATKLNLAMAAGLALPLCEWLGYTTGATSEGAAASGTQALKLVYCAVPCALKAVAAVLLWRQQAILEPVGDLVTTQ